MIANAFNWSIDDVYTRLAKFNKIYKNDRVVFTVKRNVMGHKGLFGVNVIVSYNGYDNSARNYLELDKWCENWTEVWSYIKQLAKAQWIFTSKMVFDYDRALKLIPTHKIVNCKEGNMIIVVGEFNAFPFEMINNTLVSYEDKIKNKNIKD